MNKAHLAQAIDSAQRFRESEDVRKQNQATIKAESVVAAETPARLSTRRALINFADGLGFERLLGRSDLITINYLELGLRVARSICRLQVRTLEGRPAGFGTAFLVSPSLLMTNHHVLVSDVPGEEDLVTRTVADFQYEFDADFDPRDVKTFRLDPLRFFYADKDHDLALVAINPRASDGTPLADFGFVPMIRPSGKALLDEPVTIIQHPAGADKQIALRNNRVTSLLDTFIHYETDTLPGSSGSPVFNDQWQLVALHHTGVPRLRNGKPVTRDGRIWDISMGEEAIDWIANEGVRISSIVEHLAARPDWTPTQVRVLAELGLTVRAASPAAAGAVAVGPGLELAREGMVVAPVAVAVPVIPAAPPRISVEEWQALIEDENTTEEQLAPYVMEDDRLSRAFDPAFRINPDLVVDPRRLESDRALTWANRWARERRRRRYRDRIAVGDSPFRIVSEGDSWFQYPFRLDDVIDHLMDRPDLAVYSLDAAGDLIRDMIATGEYLTALVQERPQVFLISGGGNDMVGDGRLATMLHPFTPGRTPEDYPNASFELFLQETRDQYRRLFTSVLQMFPTQRILCHGYDYVIPQGGQWLGEPMMRRSINDPALQRAIMRVVIDRVNGVLADVAQGFPTVTHLDLRGVVSPQGLLSDWYDELHPTSLGFGRVAAVFANALR